MNKVFVYGTLLSGFANHEYYLKNAENAKLVKMDTLPGFAMYDLGGFPAIKAKEGSKVIGEVYDVDDEVLGGLDHLEGVHRGFYNRIVATTDSGVEVFVYVLDDADKYQPISEGDYRSHRKRYMEADI